MLIKRCSNFDCRKVLYLKPKEEKITYGVAEFCSDECLAEYIAPIADMVFNEVIGIY